MKSESLCRTLVVMGLGMVLAACSRYTLRPSPLPARNASVAAPEVPAAASVAPQPAASVAPPPAPATSSAPGATAAAAAPVTPVCVPVQRYRALQKKAASLEAARSATHKRANALARALIATKQGTVKSASGDLQALQPILGTAVVDAGDQQLGRVVEVLADASGRVRAAIIELGGFLGVGARKIAVEWSLLEIQPAHTKDSLKLRLTRKQVDAAVTYTTPGALPDELLRAPADSTPVVPTKAAAQR